MMSNILISVDNLEHIEAYRKAGVSAFLFALEDFCVGYTTYSLEEIKEVSVSNKYILINRVLDNEGIDKLKKILVDVEGIQGIVYEDIGVYQFVHTLYPSLELIHFQNHFCTNLASVRFWLSRVSSVFLSSDITLEEMKYITENCSSPVCVPLFGHIQVMYSRRRLLSNWSEEFSVPYKNTNVLQDKATGVRFRAVENAYGTVMYSDKIYHGKEVLTLPNIKYFYVNPMFISHEIVMQFLENPNVELTETDSGFLYKETIYKLKEEE